jgi:hypothetical protein
MRSAACWYGTVACMQDTHISRLSRCCATSDKRIPRAGNAITGGKRDYLAWHVKVKSDWNNGRSDTAMSKTRSLAVDC